jgi:hypothetical protein
MSLTQIEAELEHLTSDELRRLAVKSWNAFVQKEGLLGRDEVCDEDDPRLLAALDEAIAHADAAPGKGLNGKEVLARVREWTSK